MNENSYIKTCVRPLTPETLAKFTAFCIALILFIPYLIILLAIVLENSFLRMLTQIAVKIREKL